MRLPRQIRVSLAVATLAAIGVSATAGAAVFTQNGSTDDTLPTNQIGSASTSQPATTATSTGVDISGPCDEAEHAGDPRCVGVAAAPSTSTPTSTSTSTSTSSSTSVPTTTATSTGVDISGPCDEVEHASDPRCIGGVTRNGSTSTVPNGSTSTVPNGDDSEGRVDEDRHGGRDSDDDHSGRDDQSGRDDTDDHDSDDRSGRGRDGESDDD